MAGLAAARLQLTPRTRGRVEAQDTLHQEVAQHLVGCAEAMEARFPAEKWAKRLSAKLEAYMAATTHQLVGTEGPVLLCGECGQARSRGRARPWLEAGRTGSLATARAAHAFEHRSHRMRLTCGLRWCEECGAWSATAKAVGLAAPLPRTGGRRRLDMGAQQLQERPRLAGPQDQLAEP